MGSVFASENTNEIEQKLYKNNDIQSRINDIGTNLLNCGKVQKRVVFAYNELDKKRLLDMYRELTSRQVVIYGKAYENTEDDNELAAMLAREISYIVKSYHGMWGGRIDSMQIMLGSKKFEIVADKRAVDYMVKAGYNPLGLITYINKTCPQKRSDRISRHNLTSKRLAQIYEYITYKYPEFLDDGEYEDNKYFQNFLLTSLKNRSMLNEKIRTKSTKELKYE